MSGPNVPLPPSIEGPVASSASVRSGARSGQSPAGTCGEPWATSNSGEVICHAAFIFRQGRKNRSAQAVALLVAFEAQGWERTFDWTDVTTLEDLSVVTRLAAQHDEE